MFIKNKYTTLYYSIISRAMLRTIDGYIEKHHIIPKSLGGTNQKSNLVALTAKEHRLCHILLTKMIVDPQHKIKMAYACYRMIVQHPIGMSKGSYYQYARIEFDKLNRGRVLSDKTKDLIKQARAKQTNISNQYLSGSCAESPRKGKNKFTDSGYASTSEKLKGREITWTASLSENAKSRPKCSCIKCKRVITAIQSHKHFAVCY